ncbi:RsiV family protein [Candidatus Sulfidibacterium hydrothermale]|uniref:RsiV family protein n=1 Tax=Candidatus Sulfidibacterium hydrothermale TaxID=2875962 RepID=UPI001F0A83CA|nr:RsiV family protein [Candidatus Sulfidibacterium hydrothermale]UBM61575.1 RsiV family protein [Candidatus Sulfidibacterium hydrothermale]
MIIKKLYFILILFIAFPAGSIAQQKTGYTHMKGKVGNNIPVNGNFQRSGSQMEGNYSYNLYVDDSLLHLSHIITLYGDIDKHNHVIFKQIQGNDTALSGLFTDHRFSGSWYGPDSTVLPFDMTEQYDSGSLPMQVYYLHSDKELFSKIPGSPTAEIELTLLYPEENRNIPKAITDSVVKCIQQQFFGIFQPEQTPQNLLLHSEKNFYQEFTEFNKNWKTNRKQGFNLEKKSQMTVVFNDYHLLCLQYKKRGYAGRGNPMIHITYDIINLKNGKKLTPANIFFPEADTVLRQLINQKIRVNNGLSDTISLKKAGFYTNTVPLTPNIKFTGNGITFVYNVYDIAPPSFGIQKVFLPFSVIGKYIRPASIMFPLSR